MEVCARYEKTPIIFNGGHEKLYLNFEFYNKRVFFFSYLYTEKKRGFAYDPVGKIL